MNDVKREKTFFGAFIVLAIALAGMTLGVTAQGTHSLTVSWTAPTTGGAPTTYNVKRAVSSGAEAKIATVNAPATSYVDTNGTAGVTYFYVISAQNQFGESANSNEVSATFLGDKPGVP